MTIALEKLSLKEICLPFLQANLLGADDSTVG